MNDDDMDDQNNCIQVTLTRSPLHGFGISITEGNDENNSRSLIVLDVIKNGPADGKLLPNDRIVNVNGHPVVRYMEYTAMKLIRESTDFVHLIVERRKSSMNTLENGLPVKSVVNRPRKDEKIGIILDCRYFIKRLSCKPNEVLGNIHEGDEVIKINETSIDRLTLQDAQKLIDKTKDQLILHTIPNRSHFNHQGPTSACKPLYSDYNQHVFERQKTTSHQSFSRPTSGLRYVSFFTETSSMGIRLAGGNKYGLFICEIQPNSVAYKAGLFVSDKIFSVNNIDFTIMTREEAVLYLMNLKNCQVNMIVSNLSHEYEQLLSDVGGDSFYIRAHFTSKAANDEELSVGINDIFHVTDTLYNGQIGYWVVTKLQSFSPQTKLSGIIPNRARAEELVNAAPSLDALIKSKQLSFKKKLRSKFTDKRSRSVLSLNHFKDDSMFDKTTCWKPLINSKCSTYERVRLKTITIIRPVVLLGPLADIARDRLISDYPDQFELPQTHLHTSHKTCTNIIKLQSIKDVIQKNRHCLLDITPSAIEQLNYAECYPIVIYFRASDRRMVKQIRNEYGKLYQKSTRRLFDTSEYLEHFYSYLFTSIIKLDTPANWYDTLRNQINLQQEQPIWMNYDQGIDDDFLKSEEYFISTRLSYSDEYSSFDKSSLELDVMNRKEKNHLQRVASDPAMFQKGTLTKAYLANLSHDIEDGEERYNSQRFLPLPNRCHSVIEMPTTDVDHVQRRSELLYPNTPLLNHRSSQNSKANEYPTQNRYSLNTRYENYLENEPKMISISSYPNECLPNQNSLRRPLIAPKLRPLNSIDQLSSSDSNGSIRKTLLNKPTMIGPLMNSNDKFCTESLLKQKMCSSKKHYHTEPTPTLQKPRVYTYDDQHFLIQQQNILSSSSDSSTQSLKEKSIKEVTETSAYSVHDGYGVIGSARGIMDYYGGKLSCPLTGVSLFVPVGAIPEGIRQEIYFQVCQDGSHIEKINGQLLSPIVICGPHGLQFEKPVELTLPHSAGNTAHHLSLTLHGTTQNGKTNGQQSSKSSTTNGIHHVTNSNVSVLVDHF